MLTTLELTLDWPQDNVRFSYHVGSLLHGVLMEVIDPEYADILHSDSLRPFSQFAHFDRERNSCVWKIGTVDEEAKNRILMPLCNQVDKIRIEQKGITVNITGKNLSDSITYRVLAESHYLAESPGRKITVQFLTPTTFKSDGEYVILPQIHQIYSSLLNRWQCFFTDISLEDEDLVDHLTTHTRIIGYNLKSTKFGLERTRVNSFTGEICFYISGPSSLVGLAGILFTFGEYAGVGAKTALGMGGIRVHI
jgi:CRISPR-associated endoribonuclease Cas6